MCASSSSTLRTGGPLDARATQQVQGADTGAGKGNKNKIVGLPMLQQNSDPFSALDLNMAPYV